MQKEFKSEKQRHEVAVQRFASPLRDAAPRSLEYFWSNRHTYNRASNAHWVDGGPCNVSGRATCLVVDPKHPKLLYAGSAAGGLWKSEDEGGHWTSCWPNALSQNIGAVAIDPGDGRIICATGEGNLSTASYPGSGIYASEDGGASWRSLIFRPRQRRMTVQDREAMPRRVASISYSAPDPQTGRRNTAFGSISNDEHLLGGLYLGADDGSINFVEKWSKRPYNCYSAVFHPNDSKILYACIEAGGATNGIWVSTDSGLHWDQLTERLPAGELCGRISLAISRTNPLTMYAMVSTRHRRLLGVFRSLDGGKWWDNTAGPEFNGQGQLAFNNTIAIHPEKPDIVVCGAQHLFLTTTAGENWDQISEEDPALTPRKRNPRYVHTDHHAIVMPGGRVIYSANDGGIAKSTNLGESWKKCSDGMNTVMFYAIDVSPVNARIYGGGAQDNGTLIAGVNSGIGLKRKHEDKVRFTRVLDGDGGYLVFDRDEQELVFASTFETETRCHEPGRLWARKLLLTRWRDASPKVSKAEKNVLGLTVMAIKPAAGNGRRQLFLGTNRVWSSADDGRSWTPLRSQFDGSAVTAIEIASADPQVMFVGTARGGIFRSGDGGQEWSPDLAGPEIPNRVITQIETDPRDSAVVVVTVASTGREAAALSGAAKPYSHVFQSKDSGRNWNDIDKGKLPNVVINGLAYETHPPYRIFIAGDAGPWVLNSDGRWASIAGDMPSAVISDIIYHDKTKTLTAGTYGRGIWRMKVPREFQIVPAKKRLNADALLPLIEGYFLDPQAPIPEPVSPAEGTGVDGTGLTSFTCSPVKGAIGYVFESENESGIYQVKLSPTPAAQIAVDSERNRGVTWTCWALLPGGRSSFPSRRVKFTLG